MKTLVLANQKGGVGKSAVATLLAHYLRLQGRRVLGIDLDHQGDFSQAVRLSKRAVFAGFSADRPLAEPVGALPAAEFVLVPAGPKLLALERQPDRHSAFATNLHRFLAAMSLRFDVCVVDTNPNPDIRAIAARVLLL